jgi:CRP/FNR family transcriptional regulator
MKGGPMVKLNAEQFIEVFPFFRNSPGTLVEEILSSSRPGFTRRDTAMLLEGQLCTDLELMLSGEKRIYKANPEGKEITLFEVGSGEACIINAVCAITNTPCPVNVRAISDVSSLLIPARDFRSLVATHNEVRSFVFGSIGERITSFLELLADVVFEKMDRRLFDYLVEKSENGMLPATHQRIASDLGTAREVVSRLLKDFERKGKVVLSRGSIQLTTTHFQI